jgi:hypothetical protein
MSAVAVFDVRTNLNSEVIKSRLIELWIWKQVDIIVNSKTDLTTCILEYVFGRPQEEQSIRDIVKYLLNVSKNGCIYYYPSWECYEYDEEDEDIEISINDIFTEKYEPSLCGWGMRFVIKNP